MFLQNTVLRSYRPSLISALSAAVEPTYHFKVLVPSMVAGAIIGKGGETIAQLQKDTGARVKMSKSHDFYPGKCYAIFLLRINIHVERMMVGHHHHPSYAYR